MGGKYYLNARPAPFRDESFRGYAWRLSLKNGFLSPGSMVSIMGSHFREPLSIWDVLYANLNSSSIEYLSQIKDRCLQQYILKSNFRYCPECLKEGRYHREVWDYAFLPYCSLHGVRLNDLGLRPERIIFDNHVVSNPGRLDPIRDSIFALQLLISHKLGFTHVEHTQSIFEGLTADQMQKVIVLLGSYHAFKDLRRPRKSPFKTKINSVVNVLASAGYLFSDWPNRLDELFRDSLINLESRRIYSQIGFLYLAIHRELKDAAYKFVVSAFDQIVATRWPDIIDKNSALVDQINSREPKYVSGTELSKKSGVSINRLSRLVDLGVIRGNVRRLPTGRRQITIEASQEEKLQDANVATDLLHAAKSLGLPKSCMRSLLLSGMIHGYSPRPGQTWIIELAEIGRFRETIYEGAIPSINQGKFKTLDQITRFHLPERIELYEVIRAMMDKKLAYKLTKNRGQSLLKDIQVDIDELHCLFLSDGLKSIPQIAQELGIKQEVAYHLVNMGFLAIEDHGRFGRFVTPSSLEKFRDTYIFLSDVAKLLKTSSKNIISKTKNESIAFVSGPSVDNGRQYLLKVSDWQKIKQAI